MAQDPEFEAIRYVLGIPTGLMLLLLVYQNWRDATGRTKGSTLSAPIEASPC